MSPSASISQPILPTSFMITSYNPSANAAVVTNIAIVSYQKGPSRHAYAWQIGPFWQDTLDVRWAEHTNPHTQTDTLSDTKKQTDIVCIFYEI